MAKRLGRVPQITTDIALNRAASMPLHRQLYDRLRQAILNGQLQPGQRLPSTRTLASELGISRNTASNAYEQLYAEGYLERKVGHGTRVTSELPETVFIPGAIHQKKTAPGESTHAPVSLSHLGEDVTRQAPVFSMLTLPQPNAPRAFRMGVPELHAFPWQQWSQIASHNVRSTLRNVADYQGVSGYTPLREAIASHVSITRGVHCQAEQVIIVPGAQSALDLAARLLLNPGELAWIEDPGYPGAQQALRNAGAQLAPIPVTSEGINVEVGQERYPQARLAFVTPCHQFPASVTMSLSRRFALLQWANQANAWILEDDYDSDYRFSGRPLDALQGLDTAQRVIYIGTFSKVLFPALRIGYLIVPPQLIAPFTNLCRGMHRHVPILEQLTLEAFITKGYFLRHIQHMREIYAARRALLIELLQRELGGLVEVQPPQAGLHLVCWFPPGMDDQRIAQQAGIRGLDVIPLSRLALGSLPRGGLALGYGAVNEQEIQAGIHQLAQCFTHKLALIGRPSSCSQKE